MQLSRRAFALGCLSAAAGCHRRPSSSNVGPSEAGVGGLPSARIDVDATRSIGTLSRLSGVQGSPWPIVPGEPDLTPGFRELRIQHARFPQDCLPNTLTLGGIFPDETASPDAATSYSFAAIDQHVRAARAAGAEVLWQASYDVGRSDRWVGLNLGGRPPENVERFGRVVERCLEHFNNGWAGGFDRAVANVEFLNEPDGLGGFSGAHAGRLFQVFAEFLRVVTRYNRAHPDTPVRAVGPGIPLSFAEWKAWRPRFAAALARVVADGLELPVFSFHTYGADVSPRANAELARSLRALLDEKGLQKTELWNTEWQAGDFLREHLRLDRKRVAAATEAEQALFASGLAAYAVACKLRWQGVVDRSYYYRLNRRAFPEGRSPEHHALGVGRFLSPANLPQRLGLHETLMRLAVEAAPERCPTRYQDDGLLAAQGARAPDGRTLAVLVSSLATAPRQLAIELGVGRAERWTTRLLSLDARQEAIATLSLPSPAAKAGALGLRLDIEPLSSALLLLRAG